MSIPQSGGGRIEKYNQLIEYLASGCKPKSDWRIGTEHEKFGYCKETLLPIPYSGNRSILAILKGLEKEYDWKPVKENNNIIGLSKNGANVSLEPGGGMGLSFFFLSDNSHKSLGALSFLRVLLTKIRDISLETKLKIVKIIIKTSICIDCNEAPPLES